MKDLRLYQIFYNEDTHLQLDPGFIPLDNSTNERPDWFEFWPIRSLLLNNDFADNTWVGVFSPKFFQKTGMRSHEVASAVHQASTELVSFSPWFAHIALFKNIYVQGDNFHPGFMHVFKKCVTELGLDLRLLNQAMTAQQAIYSNYFVAPYRIWREWFELADAIYGMAEDHSHPLSVSLNCATVYGGQNTYPHKIFVLERVISLLIQSKGISVEYAADLHKGALGLGFKNSPTSIKALSWLDDIKRRYQIQPSSSLIEEYEALAKELMSLRDEVPEAAYDETPLV